MSCQDLKFQIERDELGNPSSHGNEKTGNLLVISPFSLTSDSYIVFSVVKQLRMIETNLKHGPGTR